MKSTMFLNNLTVIDHAYINAAGKVIGGSFNPSFLVSGETDEVEKVVVDFSTVKKDLKKLIDHDVTGIDHKLWLLEDSLTNSVVYGEHDVEITTPCTYLRVPKSAVANLTKYTYGLKQIGRALENYLTVEMSLLYPSIQIECFNSINAHTLNNRVPRSMFSYVHGLKDSTSWGCQNNSHGHLSFIQLFVDRAQLQDYSGRDEDYVRAACPVNPTAVRSLQERIASDLNETVFIRRENLALSEANHVTVAYESRDRGTFSARYDTRHVKTQVLETETTIEFLAEWVKNRYVTELRNAGVMAFAISEGLTKGSYIEVN